MNKNNKDKLLGKCYVSHPNSSFPPHSFPKSSFHSKLHQFPNHFLSSTAMCPIALSILDCAQFSGNFIATFFFLLQLCLIAIHFIFVGNPKILGMALFGIDQLLAGFELKMQLKMIILYCGDSPVCA
jgi:hypothetical protein